MKVRISALVATLVLLLPGVSLAGGSRPNGRSVPAPVVVRVSQGGFRWGDAAIGAVGALGVATAVCGASLIRLQLRKAEP